MLPLNIRIQLKEKISEFIAKLNTSQKEYLDFFDQIRSNCISMYANLFIPSDSLLLQILQYPESFSILTFDIDYKLQETDFYQKWFLKIVKKEKAFPVGFESFIHLMQAIKKTFADKFYFKKR